MSAKRSVAKSPIADGVAFGTNDLMQRMFADSDAQWEFKMKHHDENGKLSPARSSVAKAMRKTEKIEKGREKHVGRSAGVKVYTEAGRRLKKFIPQR